RQYQGKILVLEPRRLAASAAANRMASLIGEATGETVGYRMQLENRTSDKTRIEVITEGILPRMLQTDPELHGVDMVIFDEFHERSLQSDLGLALCLQSQEVFREHPLKILVMSATLDTGKLARQLSAPVVISKGFLFPVIVRHLQKPWPDRHFFTVCEQTSRQVLQVLSEESGSVLVFLPGSGEIRQTHKLLASSQLPDDVEIHPLFGDLSLALQRKAIEPAGKERRKVVLATNIAETSLTIEGIRIVIDSGLTRRATYDPGTGMTRLTTRRISRSSADQRKGRAGRLEPGICYRLWTASEEAAMEATTPAEITEADLSSLALELSCWGAVSPDELFWLNPPAESRYQNALQLLQQLQAVDCRNRVTPHGSAMASLGAHPRIGHLLLLAAKKKQTATGCCLAAILSERDLLTGKGLKEPGRSADLTQRLSLFDPQTTVSKQAHPSLGRVKRKMRQWQKRLKNSAKESVKPELAPSLLTA
ncbi:MAG: ATP-dependent helicase HrpB, partial [Endozoicomonas sp.]